MSQSPITGAFKLNWDESVPLRLKRELSQSPITGAFKLNKAINFILSFCVESQSPITGAFKLNTRAPCA